MFFSFFILFKSLFFCQSPRLFNRFLFPHLICGIYDRFCFLKLLLSLLYRICDCCCSIKNTSHFRNEGHNYLCYMGLLLYLLYETLVIISCCYSGLFVLYRNYVFFTTWDVDCFKFWKLTLLLYKTFNCFSYVGRGCFCYGILVASATEDFYCFSWFFLLCGTWIVLMGYLYYVKS